jgi:phenylacetaldehyde dehydrogenase
MTPQARGKLIWKLADLVEQNAERLAITEDEVLALASNTRSGLGAAVWTRDISRAHRMAAAIESGQVWVNCYQAADSALPFGGTKESGWGRETCRETLEEYLETKTVVVAL